MRNQELVHIAGTEVEPFAAQLGHQLTMLNSGAKSRPDRCCGLTIWSTPTRSALVYWTWVLTDEGLPVLADPLSIKSNLLFTDPGQLTTIDDQLIGINLLVRNLPWQQEVLAHLARLGVPAVRGARTVRRLRSQHACKPVAIAA